MLAESGKYASDQLAIWAEVQRKHAKLRSYSPSDAYEALYSDYEKELDSYLNGLNPAKDCSGVAVVINGRVECIDVFDSAETLRKLWNKLAKSYAIGALEDPRDKSPKTSPKNVHVFIHKIEAARINAYDSIGVGRDVRVEAKGVVGAALVCDGRLVHAALFNLRRD